MSTKYIEVECSSCGKIMLREIRKHKYACKKFGSDYKPVCKFTCGKTKEVKCEECGLITKKSLSQFKKTNHHFCNRSCAANFSNRNRELPVVGVKELNCLVCDKLIIASKHVSIKRCDECIIKYNHQKFIHNKKLCIICGVEMIFNTPSKRKYCDDCRKDRRKEIGKAAGKKSAAKQVRRSKNEIYFAELCEKEYKNVLTNEPFFDSKYGKWDADIILPNYKLAILWNGIWHYKQVRKNHSLKQVQSRDKIKEDIIKKNEYETYIISDMGKFDKEFVEEQFEYLKFYIKERR